MEHGGYSAGHPWYYYLGGRRPRLKEIRADAEASSFGGYMARDIEQADGLSEPKRSHRLRAMRVQVCEELARDVSGYREQARALARRRQAGLDEVIEASCHDVHIGLSLKHSHLSNDFAHLAKLDELLAKQGDLFGI